MKLKIAITIVYIACLTLAAVYLMHPTTNSKGVQVAAVGESPN